MEVNNQSVIDEKSRKLIRNITILALIWGVLNLLYSSIVFGVIFILFALIIAITGRVRVIYGLGIVLWILATIQLLNATGIINLGFTEGMAQGIELILIAIANYAVGLFIMYRTRKVEKLPV